MASLTLSQEGKKVLRAKRATNPRDLNIIFMILIWVKCGLAINV
jgi:hypothetical protein